ncbi:protein translocase subunit SecF [Oscillatoria sp. FACHB-1406]|uniref:protein translocase subunit SecF n=1 Tax=Oscillatoria sp. FACHB-1406 TaxID=2692846 RepID=UPI001689349C|nr:protein translocase subunit SecF [Oscillatoria sp. FACHB-1406]MBD2579848.1 protein translocase subunit SecF [Oscillatoria sp. FACHB-1406]
MRLNVIKLQRLWWTVSIVATIAGFAAMAISYTRFNAPLRPGLDFIGGTRLQLALDCSVAGQCDKPIEVARVRDVLAQQGLEGSTIQVIDGNTLSVRTKELKPEQRNELQNALSKEIGRFDPKTVQIDTVGPTVGRELFSAGLLALVISFVGIAVYLSFRFKLDYAILAIVALFHDVMITAGFFAFLGLTPFAVEADSLFLVALLTITGFSVNDTVVIYDRVRELIAERGGKDSIQNIVDDAVNQTLTRSINTSLTTTLPLIAIFFFGGETLKYFALALIIGFISGAYSSIFIASTTLAWWRSRKGETLAVATPQDTRPANSIDKI